MSPKCYLNLIDKITPFTARAISFLARAKSLNKTEVESVQLGNTYISDMDKCPKDKCCQDKCCGCNLLFMFPGPFV